MTFRRSVNTAGTLFSWVGVLWLGVLGAVAGASDPGIAPSPESLAFFETRIRPVLVDECYSCHSSEADSVQGGLYIDSRDGLLRGGDSGPSVDLQRPGESLLIQALKHEAYEMPPSGKLAPDVIADFERWVEMGLPDPRTGEAPPPRGAIDIHGGREFWSFRALSPAEPPAVENSQWAWNEIDRFLLARLEAEGLEPADDADRAIWLRRISFALVGLPPAPDEIDAFLLDESPDAHARVVDRLLASPHFGERWGRHWLDVARFAESSGGGRTIVFKDAWRYRDYVIASVNRDKPLDEFITEQIAGDLLPHESAADEREHLVATGYLLLGAHNYEEQDKQALEMDVVDEQLDTIGRGLLGMTIACARCHDHKFDPIPTSDYYALAGILRSTDTLVHANVSTWTKRELPLTEDEAEKIRAHEAAVAEIERQIAELSTGGGAETVVLESSGEIDRLKGRLAELRQNSPPRPTAMAVRDAQLIEDCKICIRGSVRHRGPAVPRGVLQVATHGAKPDIPRDRSGRLELAEWITSAENPLTARVYVNRIWYYLFGAGLVRTLDNFGTTGEAPSHPELLDHLAEKFVEGGWRTKPLIREIVLSHAYRMSTAPSDEAGAVDPENRLLSRMNRVRLDAESLRDAMLVVSGRLDRRVGGPNILNDAVIAKSTPDNPTEYGYVFADSRRSVYTPAFRNRMHELFEVFDFADQNSAAPQRNVTTVAPQALFMLNSDFVMEQAEHAADRVLADEEASDDERIDEAFRLSLGRMPTEEERAVALVAVAGDGGSEVARNGQDDLVAKWETLFQALFGSIDFRYVD